MIKSNYMKFSTFFKPAPWYHVCVGDDISTDVKFCTSSILSAIRSMMAWRRIERKHNNKVFIRPSKYHSDRDYKQFKCPNCGNLMSQLELDHTWDWSGPHCNECGCTGFDMFISVNEPVISGRNFLNKIKGYINESDNYTC